MFSSNLFSCVINNPDNCVIVNDYFIVPFGHRCASALACKCAGIRKFSLPFDWCIPLFPNKIQKVLENNFDDFIPDVYNGIFTNKYGFSLEHFNPDINSGVKEYKRRIERFNDIINQTKKIYFVYINEDYLYDDSYRQDEFNDNIFNEMLELEKYIKDKYMNIDFNIFFFNFKQHNIPKNSNIVNFVLHCTNLYDNDTESHFDILRGFCGQILAHLFGTEPTGYYDYSVFID